jgi:exodeoxyribonuclease VII large subunit
MSCFQVDPAFTLGERARKRQEVLNKLQNEGLIDLNKSLPLPEIPQRIAVISSPTAAGFEDFMDQLENNSYGYQFDITLYKAIMQGEEAIYSIISAMEEIADKENYDVLVIIRGGGSQVDMDCFNTYDLAAAIASFPKPVLTGIGHDRDESIADIVAHTMLKTPTAVSEFLISGMIAFEQKLLEYLKTLNFITSDQLSRQNQKVLNYANRIKSATQRLIMNRDYELRSTFDKIKNSASNLLARQDALLTNMETKLTVMDPENTLTRGYTLTTLNSRIISNFGGLKANDQIETFSKEHILKSTVTEVKKR